MNMVLTRIYTLMVTAALLFGFVHGTLPAVSAAALEGAGQAVRVTVSIAGTLCLWNGILELLRKSGLSARLAACFRPWLCYLLPKASQDLETLEAVSANLSANLLGLGNAATAPGIRAAQRMALGSGGAATNELCTLVVLNTASIQLLPATVAALRTAHGCASPFDILPAVWLTSLLSVTAGLLAAKLLSRLTERRKL